MPGQIFGLISSFLSNDVFGWFWIGSLHKNMQLNAGVPQSSILEPTLFLLYIYDLPDDVRCNIGICDKCDQASDLWQQIELASECEFNL